MHARGHGEGGRSAHFEQVSSCRHGIKDSVGYTRMWSAFACPAAICDGEAKEPGGVVKAARFTAIEFSIGAIETFFPGRRGLRGIMDTTWVILKILRRLRLFCAWIGMRRSRAWDVSLRGEEGYVLET